MTEQRLASLAVGLLGLFWIGEGLQMLAFSLSSLLSLTRGDTSSNKLPVVLESVLIVALPGLLFLIARERIARWLCSRHGRSEVHVSLGAGVQAAAFAVIGAYFVVRGLSGVGGSLLFGANPWRHAWGSILQCLFGALLFVGARQLAFLWSRIRGMQAETKRPSAGGAS